MPDVLVIGGANIDIKAKTLASHVAATSNPGAVTQSFGGVGRNIASNLARLGVRTAFLTVVGNDSQGRALLESLAATGVDTSAALAMAGATGTYCAVLNDTGELETAVSDMAALESLTPDVIAHNRSGLLDANLVVADCNLRPDTLAAIAALAGHKLLVEPVSVAKSRRLLELLGSHRILVATPNLAQLGAFAPLQAINGGIARLHSLGLENIVVHAGAEGAFVSDRKNITHVPSAANDIVDVTGAGDAAVAGLVFGLIQHLPLVEAAAIGQKMAARVMASGASSLE